MALEVNVPSGAEPSKPSPSPGRQEYLVSAEAAHAMCQQHFEGLRVGDLALFEAHVHPEATNREAKDEPLECRGEGPPAFLATGNLLRGAFAGLSWTVHDVAVDGDLVVAHTTMSGRQAGTFHRYGTDGRVDSAFPSRGRRFSVTQTHWWRMRDGLMIEHWANRDDMGMALQLGWVPSTPWYVLRMLLAVRRARRAEAYRDGPVPGGIEERSRPPRS